MATTAHCAYCFEVLSASLDKRKPLALSDVEELWDEYENDAGDQHEEESEGDNTQENQKAPGTILSPKPAGVSRLLGSSPATNSSSSLQSSSSSTPSTNASTPPSKSSSRTSFRSALSRGLRGSDQSYAETSRRGEEQAFPLFVTWNITGRSGSKNLRGCIGTFEAQALDDGLRSYALTSAFEDTRFKPISAREVTSLECAVTLLTDFEPISDPMDWHLGQHGLRINFIWENRRYGSTYLPDVAREQGWTKEETIVSLMRKAGWNGGRHNWRSVNNLNVIRYQGERVSLDYADWKQWRSWVEETGRE